MDIYIADDGYVCFDRGGVFWTLHYGGWEAYLPGKPTPCFSTYSYTFPTDDELEEVDKIYDAGLEEDK